MGARVGASDGLAVGREVAATALSLVMLVAGTPAVANMALSPPLDCVSTSLLLIAFAADG